MNQLSPVCKAFIKTLTDRWLKIRAEKRNRVKHSYQYYKPQALVHAATGSSTDHYVSCSHFNSRHLYNRHFSFELLCEYIKQFCKFPNRENLNHIKIILLLSCLESLNVKCLKISEIQFTHAFKGCVTWAKARDVFCGL